MQGQEEDLAEVIQDVWNAVLGVDAEPLLSNPDDGREGHYCARVSIEGDWKGALVLDCPEELSRLAASIMFGVDPFDASEQDLTDAMGELINVIAGNARGLYGNSTNMSLPQVCIGSGFDPVTESILSDVGFHCEDIRFRLITVQTK